MSSLKAYLRLMRTHPELFNNSEETMLKIVIDSSEIGTWQIQRRIELINAGKPVVWADIGIILNDPYFLVLRDLVRFPGGFLGWYHRLINKAYLEGGCGGVAILCEMNDHLLLFKHFRHSTRKWHWEIPRGFGEPGVSAADQARVEVKEEIQGEISALVDLGIFYNNTGIEGHPIHLFFARLLSSGASSPEQRIQSFHWVTVKEYENMIASAEITDSFAIGTYARAKLMGLI